MLTSSVNLAALRAQPQDGAAPTANADNANDPAGFSSLLRQSRNAAVAPKPTIAAAPAAPEAHAAEPSASTATDAPDESTKPETTADAPDATNRGRATPRTKARGAESAARAAGTDAAAPTEKPAAERAADTDKPATATGIDPAIADWLAAQQRQPPTARAADATASDGDAGKASPTETAAARAGDAAAVVDDPKGHRAGNAPEPATPAFAATLAEQQHEAPAAAPSTTTSAVGGIGAAALAPTPEPGAASAAAAAPVAVALPTPVDAPDFAQALGLQMSVLARDGVQQAELHLNPAEMGPVSVQIVMDGTQARIDFGADLAATRHAIEAGLPELASALRDAGFTLAGGGVSQHAGSGRGGQRSGSGDTPRAAQRVSDESLVRVGAAAQRIVSRGGLDLYA